MCFLLFTTVPIFCYCWFACWSCVLWAKVTHTYSKRAFACSVYQTLSCFVRVAHRKTKHINIKSTSHLGLKDLVL